MDPRAKPLLDFISIPESRGEYNIVWGGIARHDHPPAPLVEMTIGEVLDWQESIDSKYMSEAAGRYQILEDTLRDIYKPAGFTRNDRFDEDTQDALGFYLLKRRGWDDYIAGRIGAEAFANSLAKEWASLPVVSGAKKGRSYYGGDGLNKSHVSVSAFLGAVAAVKSHAVPEPAPRPPEPVPAPMPKETPMLGPAALVARIALYLLAGDVGLSGIDVDVEAGTLTVNVESVVNILIGSGILGGTLGWRKLAAAMGGKL